MYQCLNVATVKPKRTGSIDLWGPLLNLHATVLLIGSWKPGKVRYTGLQTYLLARNFVSVSTILKICFGRWRKSNNLIRPKL